MCQVAGGDPITQPVVCSLGFLTPFHLILMEEAVSLQMGICLQNTDQFVALDAESILVSNLFMLCALITLLNKLTGAGQENGSC